MSQATLDTYAYVREVLLPALDLRHHPFVVQRPPGGGTVSSLVKVVVERGPVLLVRIWSSRGRARANAAALRFLEARGLPGPRLKLEDTGAANVLLRPKGLPRWVTAETWVEGTPAVEVPSGEAERVALLVASVLARYHAVTRSRWGRPGPLWDPRPWHAFVLATARTMIRDLAGRGVLRAAQAEEARHRYGIWKSSLMKVGTFQLVHRDVNRRNVIVPEDRKRQEVTLVDLHRLSFRTGAEDVADALHHFCRADGALGRKFLARYLDEAAPSSRVCWERTGPFFVAVNALKRLHRRTDPAAADRLGGDDPRIGAWRDEAMAIPRPPLVWPEPGSAPPERETQPA
jgi:hypothetical protein